VRWLRCYVCTKGWAGGCSGVNDPPDRSSHEGQGDVELLKAVVDYLSEHPHAMDTLEGIAQWWIPRQQVRVEASRLASALDLLTERGMLERIGSGESARYRLKKQ
jgi:hypothetical protein